MASAVFHGANFLNVFDTGDDTEKRRHAECLFDVANEVAQEAGSPDFVSLIESNSPTAWAIALQISGRRWADFDQAPEDDRYWLAPYALVQLMILNALQSFPEGGDERAVANNAATLYAHEFAYRKISGKIST
jgi:hypothetical protein